jgi:hypothetical protein
VQKTCSFRFVSHRVRPDFRDRFFIIIIIINTRRRRRRRRRSKHTYCVCVYIKRERERWYLFRVFFAPACALPRRQARPSVCSSRTFKRIRVFDRPLSLFSLITLSLNLSGCRRAWIVIRRTRNGRRYRSDRSYASNALAYTDH